MASEGANESASESMAASLEEVRTHDHDRFLTLLFVPSSRRPALVALYAFNLEIARVWFNVWFVIWPNQKIALGIVDAPAEQKPAAARTAMLFSRTNTLLSIPMLFAMVSAQNIY